MTQENRACDEEAQHEKSAGTGVAGGRRDVPLAFQHPGSFGTGVSRRHLMDAHSHAFAEASFFLSQGEQSEMGFGSRSPFPRSQSVNRTGTWDR